MWALAAPALTCVSFVLAYFAEHAGMAALVAPICLAGLAAGMVLAIAAAVMASAGSQQQPRGFMVDEPRDGST
jgi:hypothetical protein